MYLYLNAVQYCYRTVVMVFMLFLLVSFNVHAKDEVIQPKSIDFSSTALKSAGSNAESVSAGYLGQLVVGLLVVLLCIIALAWIAKRFNRLQSTPDGSLRVLGGMSMGARERIVLVQLGEKQLLLGVAPGRINTLHVLDEPIEALSGVSSSSPGQFSSMGFAEKLSAAISRNQKK